MPSPKSQVKEVGLPVDVLLKLTISGEQPDVTLEVKFAVTCAIALWVRRLKMQIISNLKFLCIVSAENGCFQM